MLITLGGLVLSVKNKRLSILFTPVIKKDGSKFKVVFIEAPLSILITWYTIPPVWTLKETIKSSLPVAPCVKAGSWTNQYMVSLALSSKEPIHLADELNAVPSVYVRDVSLVLPFEFSTEPISDCSVEPSLTLIAFVYSPFGKSLSSRLLFIRPAIKFLWMFAILFYPLILPSYIHHQSARVNVT